MPAYTPVRMPSRAVSAIEAAAPSGVVTAAADSGVGPGAGGSSFDARDRVQVERLSPAKVADDGERSEWGGEMTDSCDTDTLEIDSDEDEW